MKTDPGESKKFWIRVCLVVATIASSSGMMLASESTTTVPVIPGVTFAVATLDWGYFPGTPLLPCTLLETIYIQRFVIVTPGAPPLTVKALTDVRYPQGPLDVVESFECDGFQILLVGDAATPIAIPIDP